MYVDLAREQGNPRQVQRLAESLGVSGTAEAERLLRRLTGWAAAGGDAPAAEPVRSRALARTVGWRGDPATLVAALAHARLIERGPSGIRVTAQARTRNAGGPYAGQASSTTLRPRTTIPAPALWQAALSELAPLMNRANYDAFLAGTEGLYRDGEWFTVGAPSSYALKALADRFRPALEWAIYVASGARLRVRLVLAPPPGPLLFLPPRTDDVIPATTATDAPPPAP